MAQKSWVIADAGQGIYVDEFEIGPSDVPGTPQGWSVKKRTLRGGRQEGVDIVEVDNGQMQFTVVPTRGMGLWQARIGDATLGWKSPVVGPVHPQWVPVGEPSGLGWLDGFDELLVRCGLESNGAPEFDEQGHVKYPLHGRIANLPAHRVEVSVDENEISVTGVVDETRFHFQKVRLTAKYTTRIGQSGLAIEDEVLNLSASPTEVQMLYHANFGVPLLDGGAKLVAPVKTLVPRNRRAAEGLGGWDSYAAEQPGFEEQVYFFDLHADAGGDTLVLLKNAHGTEAVSLGFNVKQLPCFTQWKNTTAVADGYVTGLEPGTNYPNPRTFEGQQDRVVKLDGGAQQSFAVRLDWHRNAEQVKATEQEVARIQAGREAKIFEKPQEGWCDDSSKWMDDE